MKKQIRVLAIDDSPFNFNDKYSLVVGVVMRGDKYIDGVLSERVKVDGFDATNVCIEMIQKNRFKNQLKAIIIDGGSFGGFNVLDIKKINKKTKIPIITITRNRPNFNKIKIALKSNFLDWKKRYNILSEGELLEIKTKHKPIYIKLEGIDKKEAEEIIKIFTIRGVIPEPLRVAHLVASGIKRGESYGKA